MWVLSDDLHKELAKFLDLPKHVKNYTVTLHRNLTQKPPGEDRNGISSRKIW